MTELAGGELCLPQRPHSQVGAAIAYRRRRRSLFVTRTIFIVAVSVRQYNRLVQQQATFNYLCNACLISKLPFTDTQDDEPDVDVSIDSSDAIYIRYSVVKAHILFT